MISLLLACAASTDYFIKSSGQGNKCTDERGCSVKSFSMVVLHDGDHIYLKANKMDKNELQSIAKHIASSKAKDVTIIGNPTKITEKGKNAQNTDQYLLAFRDMTVELRNIDFVSLKSPVLNAVRADITFSECKIEGSGVQRTPIIELIKSTVRFEDFEFADNTVRQCMLMNFSRSDVTFSNASITGNFYSGKQLYCIFHNYNSNVTFQHSLIARSSVSKSYLLCAVGYGSFTSFEGVKFDSNKAIQLFACLNGAVTIMRNCVALSCYSGIFHGESTIAEFHGLEVSNYKGGKNVIEATASNITVSDCFFHNSHFTRCLYGDSGHFLAPCEYSVRNLTVSDATCDEGLMQMMNMYVDIRDCQFDSIKSGNQTAIGRIHNCTLLFHNNSISNLECETHGQPMIFSSLGTVSVASCIISDSFGNFLWYDNSHTELRGCIFQNVTSSLHIDDNVPQGMISNAAPGSHILVEDCVAIRCSVAAGVISVFNGVIEMKNSSFIECNGIQGTSIVCMNGTLRATGCTFDGNYAQSKGGVISSISSWITFDSCVFTRNSAKRNSALYFVNFIELSLNNVSVGANQPGFIFSAVKYGHIVITNSKFKDQQSVAIQAHAYRLNSTNTTFGCKLRCVPAINNGTMSDSTIYTSASDRLQIASDKLSAFILRAKPAVHSEYINREPWDDALTEFRAIHMNTDMDMINYSQTSWMMFFPRMFWYITPCFIVVFMRFVIAPEVDKPKED